MRESATVSAALWDLPVLGGFTAMSSLAPVHLSSFYKQRLLESIHLMAHPTKRQTEDKIDIESGKMN